MKRRAALALTIAPFLARAQTAQWTPPSLPDVTLQDQDGRHWKLRSELAVQRPLVVNFIFTGCAAVCPPQTAILRELRHALDRDVALASTLVLSLSVDPLADGPAELRAFADRHQIATGRDRGWLFLTGPRLLLAPVWKAFGIDTRAPDAHPSLVWLSDAMQQRWDRTSSLNPPADLLRRLRNVAV